MNSDLQDKDNASSADQKAKRISMLLAEISQEISDTGKEIPPDKLDKLIRKSNRGVAIGPDRISKRELLPAYLEMTEDKKGPSAGLGFSIASIASANSATSISSIDSAIQRTLRMKPRRSASGVATITVIAMPYPCSGNCCFCPSDASMLKSYLAEEPACQRALAASFDPFVQASRRLKALSEMGHIVDKLEMIVLGGTWDDYPTEYRQWFISELFRAINAGVGTAAELECERILSIYAAHGVLAKQITDRALELQPQIDSGALAYNAAVAKLYGKDSLFYHSIIQRMSESSGLTGQANRGGATENSRSSNSTTKHLLSGNLTANRGDSTLGNPTTGNPTTDNPTTDNPTTAKNPTTEISALTRLQQANETASHRMVGLSLETRPDKISLESLLAMRALGCTKVQIGVQQLSDGILNKSSRGTCTDDSRNAMALLRLLGFKSHIHFMPNLLGSDPSSDVQAFKTLFSDPALRPDEIKLYPCVAIYGTELERMYQRGEWQPYSHDDLLDLLEACELATPAYCRISRMIRDFSAGDIAAGNRKVNLRQMVDRRLDSADVQVKEIRYRELALAGADLDSLQLDEIRYKTSTTEEIFLQWLAPAGAIAGFCRLSLPDPAQIESLQGSYAKLNAADPFPIKPGDAMIRELHVYGRVTGIETGMAGEGVQHRGLGRKLVQRACDLASEASYERINVISAVGTRGYYRSLGFKDGKLYQTKPL